MSHPTAPSVSAALTPPSVPAIASTAPRHGSREGVVEPVPARFVPPWGFPLSPPPRNGRSRAHRPLPTLDGTGRHFHPLPVIWRSPLLCKGVWVRPHPGDFSPLGLARVIWFAGFYPSFTRSSFNSYVAPASSADRPGMGLGFAYGYPGSKGTQGAGVCLRTDCLVPECPIPVL